MRAGQRKRMRSEIYFCTILKNIKINRTITISETFLFSPHLQFKTAYQKCMSAVSLFFYHFKIIKINQTTTISDNFYFHRVCSLNGYRRFEAACLHIHFFFFFSTMKDWLLSLVAWIFNRSLNYLEISAPLERCVMTKKKQRNGVLTKKTRPQFQIADV